MRFILSIFCFLVPLLCKADFYYASYYLKGKITSSDAAVVANTACTLQLGKNTRVFYTDQNGNYFVEVFYGVAAPCRRMPDGTPVGDELASSRESNSDTVIVTCDKGSSHFKSNWETYYSRKKRHISLEKYKGMDVVESKNITLNNIPITIEVEVMPYRKKLEEELTELDKIPLDTFEATARIRFDYKANTIILPDGRVLPRFGDDESYKESLLWKCYTGSYPIESYIHQALIYLELRNKHIDSLFNRDILGNYPKFFNIKKKGTNEYILPVNRFKPQSRYYTFYTNKAGYITDVIYTDPLN